MSLSGDSGDPESFRVEPVLDEERLQALHQLEAATGEPVVDQVVGSFRSHSHQQLAILETAVSTGDLVAVAGAAHSLAGSAAALGAQRVSAVCRALEQAARHQEGARCSALYPHLVTSLGDLESQLTRTLT